MFPNWLSRKNIFFIAYRTQNKKNTNFKNTLNLMFFTVKKPIRIIKKQLKHFLNQAVVEKEVHKPIISVLETTTLSETRIPETLKERKKVFFG